MAFFVGLNSLALGLALRAGVSYRAGLLLTAVFAVEFATLAFLRVDANLDALMVNTRDMAFTTQPVWNFIQDGTLRNTFGFRGMHIFSAHAYLWHWLLVPPYALVPLPETILAIGAVAPAVAALGLYRVANALKLPPSVGVLLAVLLLGTLR